MTTRPTPSERIETANAQLSHLKGKAARFTDRNYENIRFYYVHIINKYTARL